MSIGMQRDNGKVNRVAKLIINPDTGPIYCCWDECDKRATVIWSVRLHEHPKHVPCGWVDQAFGDLGRHTMMTFCSQTHLLYWVSCSGSRAHELAARNQGRIYGQLPAGAKQTRLHVAPQRRVRTTEQV